MGILQTMAHSAIDLGERQPQMRLADHADLLNVTGNERVAPFDCFLLRHPLSRTLVHVATQSAPMLVARKRRVASSWQLVVQPSVKKPAGAALMNTSPLLEKEWHTGALALAAE